VIEEDLDNLRQFLEDLPWGGVLARVTRYMVFDDHEVTDD
jgi:hypothetical protein